MFISFRMQLSKIISSVKPSVESAYNALQCRTRHSIDSSPDAFTFCFRLNTSSNQDLSLYQCTRQSLKQKPSCARMGFGARVIERLNSVGMRRSTRHMRIWLATTTTVIRRRTLFYGKFCNGQQL